MTNPRTESPAWLTPLTMGEVTLLANIQAGRPSDFSFGDPDIDDPANSAQWGEERLVRGRFIAWICSDDGLRDELERLHELTVKGVRIRGTVDLTGQAIPFPISFRDCVIPDGLRLWRATVADLRLSRTHLGVIDAAAVNILGRLILCDRCRVLGTINLTSAHFGGNVEMIGIEVSNPGGIALTASQLVAEGSFRVIEGCRITGGVNLIGARIAGDFIVAESTLSFRHGAALNCDGIRVAGRTFVRQGSRINGSIRMQAASLDGECDFGSCVIEGAGGEALILVGAQIKAPLLMNSLNATGRITLRGATILGQLSCCNAQIENPGSVAFDIAAARIGGPCSLNACKIRGEMSLRSTRIEGLLSLEGSEVINPNSLAIVMDGAYVGGMALFRNGLSVTGDVKLYGLHVGADMDCTGARFVSPGRVAFSAYGATVKGGFIWRQIMPPPDGIVQLERFHVAELRDDNDSWPGGRNLILNGFTFERLGAGASSDPAQRIQWLSKQNAFFLQPYENVMRVFRSRGENQEAGTIAIAKWRERRRRTKMAWYERGWDCFLDLSFGYGYRPIRPLICLVGIWLVGAAVLGTALERGWLCPGYLAENGDVNCNIPKMYPPLSAAVMSAEGLVPLGLGNQKSWVVRGDRQEGAWVRTYLVAHRAIGWVLALLLAVSPSNLVRRE